MSCSHFFRKRFHEPIEGRFNLFDASANFLYKSPGFVAANRFKTRRLLRVFLTLLRHWRNYSRDVSERTTIMSQQQWTPVWNVARLPYSVFAEYYFCSRRLLNLVSGRSVLGLNMNVAARSSWWEWLFPTLLTWFVNGFITLVVLWRLLVSGEPLTEARSKSSTLYWRHRKQAESDVENVSFSAWRQLTVRFGSCKTKSIVAHEAQSSTKSVSYFEALNVRSNIAEPD